MTTINPPFGIKTHIPPRATALRKKNQKSTGNLIDRIKTGYEVENSIRTQALQMVVQINCCQKRHQDDIYVTVEPDHYFRKHEITTHGRNIHRIFQYTYRCQPRSMFSRNLFPSAAVWYLVFMCNGITFIKSFQIDGPFLWGWLGIEIPRLPKFPPSLIL